MLQTYKQAARGAKLSTPLGDDVLVLERLLANENLSQPFSIVVDAVATTVVDRLHACLGEPFSVEIDEGAAWAQRSFHGRLWEYVELDHDDAGYHYRLTLLPWTSFAAANRNNRVFQRLNVVDIAKKVLAGRGPLALRLSASYPAIDYCVQYQESDWEFVSRLFEHEGIYYYFDHSAGAHELVAVDDKVAHQPCPGLATVPLRPRDNQIGSEGALWSLVERRSMGPAKVTVDDYDFVQPSRSLRGSRTASRPFGAAPTRWQANAVPPGAQWPEKSEVYEYPTGYDAPNQARSTFFGERRLDELQSHTARARAQGSILSAAVGRKLKMSAPTHDGRARETEYLIVGATHRFMQNDYRSDSGAAEFSVELELMPADMQFRAPRTTPKPRILGPQTAVVVGPAGEEIYTDEHGRIKVQFHWDRLGRKDAESSCWIRVAQSVAGREWGSFVLPRIGQEVVVEFLDGDPDRPLITGAVFNGDNRLPYRLPGEMNKLVLKTRSTKGGGGYNELTLDDSQGKERVILNAQKDYDATIDKGNETRLLKEGNRTTTIDKGNDTLTLKQGNRTATLEMGNDALTVKMGDVDVKVSMGSHRTQAMQMIELKCGMSKITMDPASIKLEAMNVEIKGQILVKVNGTMVQSEASAMSTIKGALVMIN